MSTELPANPSPSAAPTHLIGLGASAGGLEALERFFKALPNDTGYAFIVVQHLSPDFKSMMPELLARHVDMPIVPALHTETLLANHIYVLTPGLALTVHGQSLLVEARAPATMPNLPINLFFESMASWGARAVAIVLSGTGTDGTLGAISVREAGGLVLAQTPSTTRFAAMPRSVIKSRCANATVDPEHMPAAIQAWVADPTAKFTPPAGQDDEELGQTSPYARILAQLRAVYDIDFEHYRAATIVRRIERRLNSGAGSISAEDYADRVINSRTELEQLFSDLLIGVTRFFRDESSFESLRSKAIEPLIDALDDKADLRVWICGCSTGEEAYSVAMLALEAFEARGIKARVRILATDLHGSSLQVSSAGLYAPESLESVPLGLREKYFVVQPSGHYKVSEDLRRTVIFSEHNVLRDAAFTRMDLVTCRNMLIYFQPQAQNRALASFHLALRSGGMLFLGDSEGTGDLNDAFDTVERESKLFRKVHGVQLAPEMRHALTSVVQQRPLVPVGDQRSRSRLSDVLLNRFMPTGMLLNERLEVEHLYGDAGRFLQPSAGKFRGDLANLLAGPLRTAVFLALRKAAAHKQSVSLADIEHRHGDQIERLRIVVDPVTDRVLPQTYFMLRIDNEALPKLVHGATHQIEPVQSSSSTQVHELETELQRVREALQHTVEELETVNEELQAGNEELMASNEELQSTNEELHAVNEELYTVNSEHELKIQELHATTADLNNLIRATEIAILFLDNESRLRMFTPAAMKLFPLQPGDIRRDLRHFMPRQADSHLADDIELALAEPQSIDRELELSDGRHLSRRLAPYQDNNNRPAGLVLTYIDVTGQAVLTEALIRREAEVRTIIESVPDLVWTRTPDGDMDFVSPQWVAYTGVAEQDQLGQGWLQQVHADDLETLQASWQSLLKAATVPSMPAFACAAMMGFSAGSMPRLAHCVTRTEESSAGTAPTPTSMTCRRSKPCFSTATLSRVT